MTFQGSPLTRPRIYRYPPLRGCELIGLKNGGPKYVFFQNIKKSKKMKKSKNVKNDIFEKNVKMAYVKYAKGGIQFRGVLNTCFFKNDKNDQKIHFFKKS